MPYPNGADRVNLPPDRRHSIHLPPLCPSANHVPVLPWRDAVYAAWSRLSHTFSVPGPVLLGGHPPHGLKPQSQRSAGVLKGCPCRHRGLMPTLTTPQKYRPNRRTLSAPTARTANPSGQRSSNRYSRQVSSLRNRTSNSFKFRG